MNKKVKLYLKTVRPASNGLEYEVMKVVNSVEWTPGDLFTRIHVKALMPRPNLEVVITG